MAALAQARELLPTIFDLTTTKSPPADTQARLIQKGVPEQAAADAITWQAVHASHLRHRADRAARDAAIPIARELLPEVFRDEDPAPVPDYAQALLVEAGVSRQARI